MNPNLISYVVVTHDRARHLSRCLESVMEQDWASKEILVVDNGSRDSTAAMLAGEFPEARVIRLGRNLGPAAGRNVGVEAARGDIVVFLDDDAVFLRRDATSRVAAAFASRPDLGVLAFRIVAADGGCEVRSSIPRRDKRAEAGDYECTYFCGAGAAIRREAMPAAGSFWERLFIYGEELDLSYRLIDDGWRLRRLHDVEVRHIETPDARPKERCAFYYSRNRFLIAVRNLPWPNVATTTAVWWLGATLRGILTGQHGTVLRGIASSLRLGREALRVRRVLGREARRALAVHSGRLWY